MKRIGFLLLFALLGVSLSAQTLSRVEPPSWWVGMNSNELQLMVYGANISNSEVKFSYPGVRLVSVVRVANPNYLFINLIIEDGVKPGKFDIFFKFSKKKVLTYTFELREREPGSANRKGFDASDVIYLLYPDRFANGDPTNDQVQGMRDEHNRLDPYGRHGGDIQGIINNLEYFSKLGVTTLWLNPVLENDQISQSYHGYAITDFYRVDRRMGTNELYRELVKAAHQQGLKVIKDLIFNHCGDMHWWMSDLPMSDWVNWWPEHTQSNYRQSAAFDPHASLRDVKLMTNGWFARQMPDLNQQNPFVAKYLTQNTIWWIEYAGLNGFRMDTHPYADKTFMAQWCKAIATEYPNFTIVGETWYNSSASISYWQKDARNADGYNSHLESVMDFPLMNAINKAFDEPDGWDTGMARLYDVLTQDFVYANHNNLLIFVDNHDKGRFQRDTTLDIARLKLAIAFLLTTRGIPQIYYGTEILLPGDVDKGGHGDIRRDFPGGWPSDSRTAFTAQGRTTSENDIWNYISNILHWRQSASAIHSGKLTHFNPDNGVYTYFRHNQNQTVMVIINNGYEQKEIDGGKLQEILSRFSAGTDIISGQQLTNLSKIDLAPRTAMIIELR